MRLGRTVPLLIGALAASCVGWPGGIHATLRYSPSQHTLRVETVPPGGAAARAGLQASDEILAIDGAAVSELSDAQVVERLRGEVGTRVRLRIRHGSEERDVVIERQPYRSVVGGG